MKYILIGIVTLSLGLNLFFLRHQIKKVISKPIRTTFEKYKILIWPSAMTYMGAYLCLCADWVAKYNTIKGFYLSFIFIPILYTLLMWSVTKGADKDPVLDLFEGDKEKKRVAIVVYYVYSILLFIISICLMTEVHNKWPLVTDFRGFLTVLIGLCGASVIKDIISLGVHVYTESKKQIKSK